MTNEAVQISDGLFHAQIGDTEIAFDPIEALTERNVIAQRRKGETGFEYLTDYIAWIEKNATPAVKLRPGQAAALFDAVYLEWARSQKVFTDALQSLSSTESIPSD